MWQPRSQVRHSPSAATFTVAALLVVSSPLAAGQLVVETSVEHSDYSEHGDATTVTAAVAWRAPAWSLTLSVPAVRQEARELLRTGPGPVPDGRRLGRDSGGAHGGREGGGDPGGGAGEGTGGEPGGGDGGDGGGGGGDEGSGGGGSGGSDGSLDETTGIGDPVLRLDVALPAVLPAGAGWGLFGAVKGPLAGDDLGSGEWDAEAGVTAWRTGLLVDVFAELGYWLLGDPEGVELDDVFAWRAYVTRRLAGGGWAFAVLTRGATEVAEGAGSTAQAGAWIGRFLGRGRSLGLTASAGLGGAAPDWSVALSWRMGVTGLRPETGP